MALNGHGAVRMYSGLDDEGIWKLSGPTFLSLARWDLLVVAASEAVFEDRSSIETPNHGIAGDTDGRKCAGNLSPIRLTTELKH